MVVLATLSITASASGTVTPPSDAIAVGDLKIWPTNTGDTLTAGTDYAYDTTVGILTVQFATPLTIANADATTATANRIVVASNISADITLAGVNMDNSTASPFAIEKDSKGNVTINLKDGTTNTLKGGNCAALQKEGSGIGKLTIQAGTLGTGELIVESYQGAGIGGNCNSNGSVSNITITGGMVMATSTYGAGIGSGSSDESDSSSIGSGIGTNSSGNVSNITVSGGYVTATSTSGVGIGSGTTDEDVGGTKGSTSNVVITGGSVKVSSFGCQPTDSEGNNVYLLTIDTSGADTVSINGKGYPDWHYFYYFYSTGSGVWGANPEIYVYLPDATHSVTVGGNTTVMLYNSTSSSFENATICLFDSTGTLKDAYTDLQTALTAAVAGDILKLQDNVDTAATVEINKNLTLDLNGYVLKMTGSGMDLAVTARIDALVAGAQGTLKDAEGRLALLEAELAEISQRIAALERANEQLEKELAAKGEGGTDNAALEAKNNAQDAEVARLQTFITVVCIIACVSLAGNVAIVTVALILKRKRIH